MSHRENDSVFWISIGGFAIGLFVALLIAAVLPRSSGDLVRARELGIISYTTYFGYPKSWEVRNYLISILLVPGIMGLALILWNRRARSDGTDPSPHVRGYHPARRESLWSLRDLLCLLGLIVLSWDLGWIEGWIGLPSFLYEEGTHLSWLYSILHGRLLYRDVVPVYGPLVDYPAALLARWFGLSISLWRGYLAFLNVIGLLIVSQVLRVLVARRWLFWSTAFVFFMTYTPGVPGLSWSICRVSTGFLALLPLFQHLRSGRSLPLVWSGLLAGLSILFSQEVGAAATVTVIIMLSVQSFNESVGIREWLRRTLVFVAPVGCVLAIAISIFSLINAHSFLRHLTQFGVFSSLGFMSLPFPSLFHESPTLDWGFAIRLPFVIKWAYYWPMLAYLFGLGWFVSRAWHRILTEKEAISMTIVVFGVILFRVVLARSDGSHLFFVLPPALVFACWCVEVLIGTLQKRPMRSGRSWTAVGAIGILVVSLMTPLVTTSGEQNAARFLGSLTHWRTKFTVEDEYRRRGLRRLNIDGARNAFLPVARADSIEATVRWLQSEMNPKDSVYVFVDSPMFYYLIGRLSPTAYVTAMNIPDHTETERVIHDLERNAPRFAVIDSLDPIDHVPVEYRHRRILEYLKANYRFMRMYPPFKILERRTGAANSTFSLTEDASSRL